MPRLFALLVFVVGSWAASAAAQDCEKPPSGTPAADAIVDLTATSSWAGPIPIHTSIHSAIASLTDRTGDQIEAICVEPGTYRGGFVLAHDDLQVWLYSSRGPRYTFIRDVGRGPLPKSGIELAAGPGDPGTSPPGAAYDADVVIRGFDVAGYSNVAPNNNVLWYHGACLFSNDTALEMQSMRLSGCTNTGWGGAVFHDDRNLSIRYSAFFENEGDRGGAVAALGPVTTVRNTIFADNSALDHSGALFALGDVLYLGQVGFMDNQAVEDAGAVYASGQDQIELAGGFFYKNHALNDWAGALWFSPTSGMSNQPPAQLLIEGTQFVGNSSGGDAGAIRISPTMTTLTHAELYDVTFRGNVAGVDGGALVGRDLDLVIEGSEFIGNTAYQAAGFAGSYSALEMSDCSFEDNIATTGAAALDWEDAAGPTIIHDSTFTGNESGGGHSGLMRINDAGSIAIERVAMLENITDSTQLLFLDGTHAELTNVLIAQNQVDEYVLRFWGPYSGTPMNVTADHLTVAWNESTTGPAPVASQWQVQGTIERSVIAFNGQDAQQIDLPDVDVVDSIVHQVGGATAIAASETGVQYVNPMFEADPADPAESSLNEQAPWLYPVGVEYDYRAAAGSPMIDAAVAANCLGSQEIGAAGGVNGCW